MENYYRIYSREHQAYWRGHRFGYTESKETAGQFTEAEAQEICYKANLFVPDGQPPEETMELVLNE